nr:nucleotidyl transferase AbiEii/AbiGii toxin family protein [Mesorhizobium mediterraneum]
MQRDKGRDLYDLAYALETFNGLDLDRIATLFGRYLELSGQSISRAQSQERMLAKLTSSRYFLLNQPNA